MSCCQRMNVCTPLFLASRKYLGINISQNSNNSSIANFTAIIEKIKKKSWLQRDLSLKGRVLLTKAGRLSRLAYAAQSLYVDKSICKTEYCLTSYWKIKKHYLRKSVVLNNKKSGGLKLIDFDSLNITFKIKWIGNDLKNPNYIWYPVCLSHLGGLEFA